MRSRSAVYRRLCVGTRRAADQHRSSGFRHSGTGVPVRLLARIGRPSGRGAPGPDLSAALSVAERFGVRGEGTYDPSEFGKAAVALTSAYREARRGLNIPPLALEAFVCAAAFTNLAFQSCTPAQRTSTVFHTNVQKFATGYCRDLISGVPFALE
jgi:hypothetical protein